MKEVVFKNKLFYQLLICAILALLGYNLYALVRGSQVYVLIPIILELILLILIFTRNQYAKTLILVWSIIALIVGPCAGFVANLMDNYDNGFASFKTELYIENLLLLIAGIIVVSYTRNTVVVVSKFEDS